MYWLLWIACGAASLVALLFIVGWLMPREHRATAALEVPADAETVRTLIRDVSAVPTWRPRVTKVEILDGPPTCPVRWKEYTGRDALPLEAVPSDDPNRIVTRIIDDGMPFGGTWTFDLAPTATGTRVRITENGFIKVPPFRVIMRLLIGYSATLRGYLRDLGRKLETQSNIEP